MKAIVRDWRRRLEKLARPRDTEPLPVRLDRRRIYVLPTGFGMFIALLLSTMLIGALNYNNNPALMLALMLAAAAIASTIMAHLQLSGLRLELVSAEPAFAGTPMRMRLLLARVDARPRRGLRLKHDEAVSYVDLVGDDHVEGELPLTTERRGWRDLGRIQLSTTQPLGIVRAWSWAWPEVPLLVYPKPEESAPPLPEGGGNPKATRVHASGEELHQLRPYRVGDPRRAISWKHSARRDTLLVREYERPVGIEIVLDWRALNALPYELRISRLTRWVLDAEREGRRYRLLLPGQTLGPGQGPQHQHQCLRALALMPHV